MPAHPTTTTQARRRVRLPRLVLLAATASLATGLVAGPSPAGAAPKGPTSSCKPGDMTTVNNKKYVCNKKGKWVHVMNLVAGGAQITQVTQIATVAPTTPVAAPTSIATAAPVAASTSVADPSSDPATVYKGKTDTKVQCLVPEASGLVDAGDTVTIRVDVYDAQGHYQHQEIHTYICGSDGNLHEVAAIVVGATVTLPDVVAVQQVQQVPSTQPTTTALPAGVAAATVGALR